MEFKKGYTLEEMKELYKWFDEQKYENSIDMGHGIKVNDVKTLVEGSRTVAFAKPENPTYSGQLRFLFNVREALIEQGKVIEN
jgi:hypothetical protein